MGDSNGCMPVLNGMWYDPGTRRYYRVTHEQPAPRPEPPPRRRPRTTLDTPRLARLRETKHLPVASLSAALLRDAQRRLVNVDTDVKTGAKDHAGCLPVATEGASIELLHYPSGGRVEELALAHRPLALAWRSRTRLLAVAIRASARYDHVMVVRFPQREEPLSLLVPHVVHGQVREIALNDAGRLLAAGARRTHVFVALRSNASVLLHPDNSDALCTELMGENDAIVGTRAGNLFRWDVRAGGPPTSTLSRRGEGASVSCVRLSADPNRVFVSTMRNVPQNLAIWDWRMVAGGPVMWFAGHRNEYKPIKFDVEESAGVLMAGGDDGLLRLWDVNRGGEALNDLSFGNEVPLAVKFACWQHDKDAGNVRPGAWICGEDTLHVLEMGAQHHSSCDSELAGV